MKIKIKNDKGNIFNVIIDSKVPKNAQEGDVWIDTSLTNSDGYTMLEAMERTFKVVNPKDNMNISLMESDFHDANSNNAYEKALEKYKNIKNPTSKDRLVIKLLEHKIANGGEYVNSFNCPTEIIGGGNGFKQIKDIVISYLLKCARLIIKVLKKIYIKEEKRTKRRIKS